MIFMVSVFTRMGKLLIPPTGITAKLEVFYEMV